MANEVHIPINPALPVGFDDTPNGQRPASHQMWWFRPYLVTVGNGYLLRCLDGGAWDRSSCKGRFAELPAALEAAQDLEASCQVYRTMEIEEALILRWYQLTAILDIDDKGDMKVRPMTPKDVRL